MCFVPWWRPVWRMDQIIPHPFPLPCWGLVVEETKCQAGWCWALHSSMYCTMWALLQQCEEWPACRWDGWFKTWKKIWEDQLHLFAYKGNSNAQTLNLCCASVWSYVYIGPDACVVCGFKGMCDRALMYRNMKKQEVSAIKLQLLLWNSTDQSLFSLELCFMITCFALVGSFRFLPFHAKWKCVFHTLRMKRR